MWCGEYQYRSYTSAYIGRDSLLPTREDTGGARVVLELTPPQVNGKERDGGEGAKVSLVRHPHWRLSAQAYVGYWWLHSSRHFVIKASGLASFWTRVAAIVPTWYICMVVVREVGVRKRASKPKHEQMNHHSSTRTIQPEPARKKSLQSCQQFANLHVMKHKVSKVLLFQGYCTPRLPGCSCQNHRAPPRKQCRRCSHWTALHPCTRLYSTMELALGPQAEPQLQIEVQTQVPWLTRVLRIKMKNGPLTLARKNKNKHAMGMHHVLVLVNSGGWVKWEMICVGVSTFQNYNGNLLGQPGGMQQRLKSSPREEVEVFPILKKDNQHKRELLHA